MKKYPNKESTKPIKITKSTHKRLEKYADRVGVPRQKIADLAIATYLDINDAWHCLDNEVSKLGC